MLLTCLIPSGARYEADRGNRFVPSHPKPKTNEKNSLLPERASEPPAKNRPRFTHDLRANRLPTKSMRTINHSLLTIIALAGLGLPPPAQGPAFTYQGRLNDGANPANGNYDLRFTIYDAITNGGAVAGPLTMSPTFVSNGLFTVTLDFGAGVFTGADRWVDIAARPPCGGAFTTLFLLKI